MCVESPQMHVHIIWHLFKPKNFISSCSVRVPVMVSARDLSLTKKSGPYNWPTVFKFIVNFVNKE